MRVTSLFLAGVLAVLTSAQSPSTTATASAAQSSQLACLKACDPGDVSCTSRCIAVPNPNESQVNATNNCVAACPRGTGTADDNLAYAECVDDCIGRYYFTTSGTPAPTGGAGSGSNSNVNAATGVSAFTSDAAAATGTGSATGTGTGSAASSTSTGAADVLHVAGSAAGVLGLLAALLAV
ncbi:hypothetical protein B0T17DRAFT_335872 [Bombardia bombarda]|uniref:Uncharacterized protein n=1 Tax=Bombardia bombarda TaxID=252184 RepID=A0AA40BYH5_9PEZI|nr:hypothetical protein B0T17DRAFT_335872 [Bombardia bombarda]